MENCILALSCAVLSVGLALFYRYPEVLYVSVLLIIFACLFLIWLFLRKIVSYCLFPGSLWFFSRSLELLYSKEISLQVFKKLEKLKIYLIDLNSQKFEETFHFDSSSKKLVNTLIENFQTMQNISSNQQKFQTLLMSLKTYIEHISIKCNTEEMNFWSYLDGNHNREVEYFSYILNDQNQEYVKKSISTINSLQNMLKKHFESKSCFSKFLQYFQSITIGTLDYMRSDLMNRFYCEQNLINNAIDSIYIKCDEDSDSAVMICNPNAGFYEFIYFQSEWLEFYLSRGINVILWNYRGYGLSKGRPHVRQNVEDGKKVIEFYLTSKKIQKFSLHGESIGGTVAIQLAQDSRCQFILADRTFGCLSDVIKYGYGKFAYFMYRLTLLPDINNTQTYLQLKCYKVITSDPCDKIIPDFVSLKSSVALAFIGKVSMSPGTYLARQSYKSLNHILSYTELCQFTCTLSTLLTKYLKLIDEEPFDKRKTTLKTEINEDHDRLTHLKFINLLSSIDSCGVTLKSAVFHKYCCFVMSIWLLSLELWGSFNGFLFSLDLSSISASLSDLKECIGYINKLQSHGDYLQFKTISLTLEKIQNYIQVTLQRTSSSHRDVLCTRDYSAAGAFMLVNCGHGGHFNNMNRHNLHIHLVQSSFILINPQPVCP